MSSDTESTESTASSESTESAASTESTESAASTESTAGSDGSDLAKVDLTDLEHFADGPPHELFARMRSEARVRWNPTADGPEFWSLTCAEDIKLVSEDPETFSSSRGGVFLQPDTLAPLDFARNWVLFKDPPEHEKYREIVRSAFMPRTLLMIEDLVREIVVDTLGKVTERGECDLVRDVAVPIPLNVIGRLLGAPDEDLDQLREWTDEIQDGITNSKDLTSTLEQMSDHLVKLVDNQVVRGVDSLANMLANPENDDDRLSEEEIAAYFGILLFAGNDPTRNALASGVLALLDNPDQLELLRNEPNLLRNSRSGLAPIAIEEILRWSSPVNYFARTATKDTSIAGVDIKADDRLVMWYASGNRDSEMLPEADTFNIDRDLADLPHLAFGGGGPHSCLGAFLANKMISVTLTEMLARWSDIERNGDVGRVKSAFVNSLTSLPITFKAIENPVTDKPKDRPEDEQPEEGKSAERKADAEESDAEEPEAEQSEAEESGAEESGAEQAEGERSSAEAAN